MLTLESVSDFLYNDKVFCCRVGNLIHISQVHTSTTGRTATLDLDLAFPRRLEEPRFRIVSYKDEILIIRVRTSKGRKLAVFKIKHVQDQKHKPELMITVPQNRLELIRNDSDYVVVGTYRDASDGIGATWHFSIFSLHGLPPRRLENIGNFGTSEVGIKVVAEMLDGYLWVISSQITHDAEGPDPTSFYGGCRVPLASVDLPAESQAPSSSNSVAQPSTTTNLEPTYYRLWRRQHREGVIHDGWTQLSLSHSESAAATHSNLDSRNKHTLEPDSSMAQAPSQKPAPEPQLLPYIITETRAEWTSDRANPIRSFYSTTFTPLSDSPEAVIPAAAPGPGEVHLSPLQRLAKATRMNDSEEYIETMLAEVGPDRVDCLLGRRERLAEVPITDHDNHASEHSFRPLDVLHRSFDSSAGAAMDIVLDDTAANQQPSPLLRLHSSATRHAALWPPRNSGMSSLLADLFRPPPQNRQLKAFSDFRAIAFGAKAFPGETSRVTIVSFDPLADWLEVPGIHAVNVKEALSLTQNAPEMPKAKLVPDLAINVGSQPTSSSKGKMTRASTPATPESDWGIDGMSASAPGSPEPGDYQPIMGGSGMDLDVPESRVEEGKLFRFGSPPPSDSEGEYDGGLAVLYGDL